MRHGVKTSKLQRNASHRRALLANQACSLILNGRITTTLAKAKALRPYVEKLITLAKRGDVHSRRLATATIHNTTAVKRLFDEIAPLCAERKGGYTPVSYTHSDAADERSSVDLGGRRIIKKKNNIC